MIARAMYPSFPRNRWETEAKAEHGWGNGDSLVVSLHSTTAVVILFDSGMGPGRILVSPQFCTDRPSASMQTAIFRSFVLVLSYDSRGGVNPQISPGT